MVRNLPAMQETQVRSLGQEDPLKKEMATYSNILAWRFPWTEEPDGLQSTRSQRVGHNWVTNTHLNQKRLPSAPSVQFSRSVISDSLRLHGLWHARPPCLLPTPRVYSSSCPLSRWCHPIISSSVDPFSSCPQSFPELGSFPVSQFCASGGQSTGDSASASDLPMNIQDLFPLGWTGWISVQSKGLSRVFSNTTVQKHQFFSAQPSL